MASHITVIAGGLIKWRFCGWIDWKYHLETVAPSIQTHPSRKSHKNPRQSKHFSSFQIHDWNLFLTERSRGVSLVILRIFISSMTVTFITSPRFMPLNFRLDALLWLVCATWHPPVLKFGDCDQLPVERDSDFILDDESLNKYIHDEAFNLFYFAKMFEYNCQA